MQSGNVEHVKISLFLGLKRLKKISPPQTDKYV